MLINPYVNNILLLIYIVKDVVTYCRWFAVQEEDGIDKMQTISPHLLLVRISKRLSGKQIKKLRMSRRFNVSGRI